MSKQQVSAAERFRRRVRAALELFEPRAGGNKKPRSTPRDRGGRTLKDIAFLAFWAKKDPMDKVKIDANVLPLVIALDSIPGAYTFSSCGGHANPGKGQEPEGTFNVNFNVSRNRTGWRALAIIQSAIQQTATGLDNKLILLPWADPDDGSPEGIHFEIRGKDGAEPAELAAAIGLRPGGTNIIGTKGLKTGFEESRT